MLIVASFFPPVYYGFLCKPPTRIFYLSTTAGLGEAISCIYSSYQHIQLYTQLWSASVL